MGKEECGEEEREEVGLQVWTPDLVGSEDLGKFGMGPGT